MTLAEQHNWTPEQIDRMDPDFIIELFAQKEARADHILFESERDPKQQESRRKQQIARRKVEIMKRREQRGNSKY